MYASTFDFLAAEQSVAGSLLIDGGCFADVSEIVSASDFLSPLCRLVFEAAADLARDGRQLDAITIAERCGSTIDRDALAQLVEITPTSANAREYACIVADHSRRRQAVDLARSIIESDAEKTDALISRAYSGFETLAQNAVGGRLATTRECVGQFLASIGSQNKVNTGYKRLDEILGGGLLRGGLYLIAARPGMGKTSFALNLAEQIGGAVLFVSLEMSENQITAKRLARASCVQSQRLLMGDNLTEEEKRRIDDGARKLSASSIIVNRRSGLTVSEIGLLARSIKGLRAVFLDYIGLLRAEGTRSRYESVSDNSAALKRLAVNLDVPIVALAQLNRRAEDRDDKRPQLADLRDSGSLEQDADAVMLLYRSDYYQRNDRAAGNRPSPLEVEVAKNRHAGCGKIGFEAHLPTNRIYECQ